MLRVGVDTMPPIPKDTTDRNRTSPLAFTGNKFEFRMLGSSQSISGPNIALNTIMAEELGQFADILEKAEDFDSALHALVCDVFTKHQRIIFSGNGYSEEWKEEAAKRGLSNLSSTAKCLPTYISDRNVQLVTKHGIFTEAEFHARYAIYLEAYNKIVRIEARTMVDMAAHQIYPAAMRYCDDLCQALYHKQAMKLPCKAETELAHVMAETTDKLHEATKDLYHALHAVPSGAEDASRYYANQIIPKMETLRAHADQLERTTAKSYWPYPTYSDLLFY